MICAILPSRGYNPVPVETYAEAMSIIMRGETRIDIILCDIEPRSGIDGLDFVEELSDQPVSGSPVIFMSGNYSLIESERRLKLSPFALKKPFTIPSLEMVLGVAAAEVLEKRPPE